LPLLSRWRWPQDVAEQGERPPLEPGGPLAPPRVQRAPSPAAPLILADSAGCPADFAPVAVEFFFGPSSIVTSFWTCSPTRPTFLDIFLLDCEQAFIECLRGMLFFFPGGGNQYPRAPVPPTIQLAPAFHPPTRWSQSPPRGRAAISSRSGCRWRAPWPRPTSTNSPTASSPSSPGPPCASHPTATDRWVGFVTELSPLESSLVRRLRFCGKFEMTAPKTPSQLLLTTLPRGVQCARSQRFLLATKWE